MLCDIDGTVTNYWYIIILYEFSFSFDVKAVFLHLSDYLKTTYIHTGIAELLSKKMDMAFYKTNGNCKIFYKKKFKVFYHSIIEQKIYQ